MSETEIFKTYLEFVSYKSYKFYEITISANTVTVTFGRIGYSGTQKVKYFSSPDEAKKFYDRQIKQKMKGGYSSAIKGKRLPKLKPSHPNQLAIPF
jgi:predicted DNA-binding WGR domain protein